MFCRFMPFLGSCYAIIMLIPVKTDLCHDIGSSKSGATVQTRLSEQLHGHARYPRRDHQRNAGAEKIEGTASREMKKMMMTMTMKEHMSRGLRFSHIAPIYHSSLTALALGAMAE